MNSQIPAGGFSEKTPRPASPKAIEAAGVARESFARLIICGIVLGMLVICFAIAMWREANYARDILLVIGSTLGFLVGREYGSRND